MALGVLAPPSMGPAAGGPAGPVPGGSFAPRPPAAPSPYAGAGSGTGIDWGALGGAQSHAQQLAGQTAADQQAAFAATPGLSTALQFFSGNAGPQMADLANQATGLAGQSGFNDANYLTQQGYLKTNNALDQQQLGLQQGATNRQLGQQPALQDIMNQLFGIGARNDQQTLDQQNRAVMSKNAANGSTNTPGYGTALTDNQNQYQNSRDTAIQTNRRDQINLSEQKAGLQDRASSLGLSQQALANTLQQGLEKLGVDHYMTSQDLQDKLFSNDEAQRAAAEQIYRQALDYSGYFSRMQTAQGTPTPAPATPAQNTATVTAQKKKQAAPYPINYDPLGTNVSPVTMPRR